MSNFLVTIMYTYHLLLAWVNLYDHKVTNYTDIATNY